MSVHSLQCFGFLCNILNVCSNAHYTIVQSQWSCSSSVHYSRCTENLVCHTRVTLVSLLYTCVHFLGPVLFCVTRIHVYTGVDLLAAQNLLDRMELFVDLKNLVKLDGRRSLTNLILPFSAIFTTCHFKNCCFQKLIVLCLNFTLTNKRESQKNHYLGEYLNNFNANFLFSTKFWTTELK